MLTNLTKKTRRKFYKKWLYKITLNFPGAYALRVYKRDAVIDICNASEPPDKLYVTWRDKVWTNRRDVLHIINFLDQYDEKDWKKRVQGNWLDLYTNDLDFYNEVSEEFKSYVVHRFEPDPTLKDKIDDGKTILVKKYPKDRFKFRVYLYPHNIKDRQDKQNFIDWLEAQKPRVTCTDSIKKWFMNTAGNWDRRYILVEDDGTILMMKLRNPDVVGSVYKFEIE